MASNLNDLLLESALKEGYENGPIGWIIIRVATRKVVAANKAALDIFCATKDQLIGTICQTAICRLPTGQCPIIDHDAVICEREQVISRMSGRQIPVLRLAKTIMFLGEQYIVENMIDLTKMKVNPREKSEDYRILFYENPQAVAVCDKDFGIVEANPSFASLFGCSAAAVKGLDVINLFTPKNHMAENDWIRQQLLSGCVVCQTTRQRPDHQEINVSLYGSAISLNGNITGFIVIFQDNTEVMAVREELNLLVEEQNQSLGKTRVLNEQLSVTSGITRHDIRNKLMALTLKAHVAKKHLKDNPEVLNCLVDIEAITKNIARLLELAKTYELLGTEELTSINVGKMVEEAASLFVDLKGVTIINECEEVQVNADSMLCELFHNMIDNSLKYGPPKITEIKVYAQINSEGATELVYEDNGNGIDTQIKNRLFEKGVTTKGTGYGLWLIRRICEMYGWTVQEKGVYGQGVRFVMTIPNDISSVTLLT